MPEQDKIKQLEKLIEKELDDALDCNRYEHICKVIETKSGREKVADRVKHLILFDDFDDIQACLTHIENEMYMNE